MKNKNKIKKKENNKTKSNIHNSNTFSTEILFLEILEYIIQLGC